MENNTQQPVQVARCEKHGLRYNAATQSGCARCRREAGQTNGAPLKKMVGNQSLPLPMALLLTAFVILGTALTFFQLHSLAYEATREHREALTPIVDSLEEDGSEPIPKVIE